MAYPPIALVQVQYNGILSVILNDRPKAYYSRAAQVRLDTTNIVLDPVTGLPTVTVNFNTPVKDTNFAPVGFSIFNIGDALIDIAFIQVIAIIAQSQTGFKVLLSANPPPTSNYYMNWAIAEITNP